MLMDKEIGLYNLKTKNMKTILINILFIIVIITSTTIVLLASYNGYDVKMAFVILVPGYILGLLLNKKYQNTNFMKWIQILSFTVISIYYLYVMFF
jgi:uncharacterized membrane protein